MTILFQVCADQETQVEACHGLPAPAQQPVDGQKRARDANRNVAHQRRMRRTSLGFWQRIRIQLAVVNDEKLKSRRVATSDDETSKSRLPFKSQGWDSPNSSIMLSSFSGVFHLKSTNKTNSRVLTLVNLSPHTTVKFCSLSRTKLRKNTVLVFWSSLASLPYSVVFEKTFLLSYAFWAALFF